MRATQTGKLQTYLLVAAFTVLLLLGLFLVRVVLPALRAM